MLTSGIFSRVSRTTILFADADANARQEYQAVANVAGFGVELAGDGPEAITLANILLPDVIVLDALLPRLDGVEVARRLRVSPRTSAVPLVLVSREQSERFDAAVRQTRCEGHMTKPFSIDELLRLVAALVLARRGVPPSCGEAP